MSQPLADLEQQRAAILRQISGLGDFRRGSITSITGPCGKPSCHCHQPNHPGHGPNIRLTRKVRGQTVSETFSSPGALRKAQQAVAEFHRFRQLSRELLELNEHICALRPVEETLTAEGEKRPRRSRKKSPKK